MDAPNTSNIPEGMWKWFYVEVLSQAILLKGVPTRVTRVSNNCTKKRYDVTMYQLYLSRTFFPNHILLIEWQIPTAILKFYNTSLTEKNLSIIRWMLSRDRGSNTTCDVPCPCHLRSTKYVITFSNAFCLRIMALIPLAVFLAPITW